MFQKKKKWGIFTNDVTKAIRKNEVGLGILNKQRKTAKKEIKKKINKTYRDSGVSWFRQKTGFTSRMDAGKVDRLIDLRKAKAGLKEEKYLIRQLKEIELRKQKTKELMDELIAKKKRKFNQFLDPYNSQKKKKKIWQKRFKCFFKT